MNIKALTSPWYVMMVGMPATGKTTFINNMKHPSSYELLSTDRYIEAEAKFYGETYNDVFENTIKEAMKCFEEDLEYSLKLEKNIVHDQTNLSRKKRKSIIDRIPNDYYKLCIALTCTEEDWQKRLANRPGKVIPVNILKSMGERLEHVWNDEGFDDVIYRNTSGF